MYVCQHSAASRSFYIRTVRITTRRNYSRCFARIQHKHGCSLPVKRARLWFLIGRCFRHIVVQKSIATKENLQMKFTMRRGKKFLRLFHCATERFYRSGAWLLVFVAVLSFAQENRHDVWHSISLLYLYFWNYTASQHGCLHFHWSFFFPFHSATQFAHNNLSNIGIWDSWDKLNYTKKSGEARNRQ